MKSIWMGPMHRILNVLGVSAPLALFVIASFATPASAISADLAIKCREMAIKAHPPTVPGAKKGSAAAQRVYYQSCIANGGIGPDDDPQKDAAPPAK